MSGPVVEVSPPSGAQPGRRTIRSPRNFAAGLTLVFLALFIFWAGRALESGVLRAVGPGFMPRTVAILIAVFGIGIATAGLVKDGPDLEKWRWRAPVFVCAAILAFGGTIRMTGLALAGPLVVIIGGYASNEARFRELVIFAVVITVACIALFRFALGLSIPVFTIPGVITV